MYGNITRCQICDSVNHWRNSCPDRNISTYQEEVEVDNKDLWEEEEKLTYEISHAVTLGEEIEDPTLLTYTCETMSVGVLDSGAPNSVCGSKWLKCYLSTLSEKDKKEVTYEKTNNYYKLGCGRKIKADQKVTIQGPHSPRRVPLQVFPGHFPGRFSSISRFFSLRGLAKSAIFQVEF